MPVRRAGSAKFGASIVSQGSADLAGGDLLAGRAGRDGGGRQRPMD
jgi:hypothetical protein